MAINPMQRRSRNSMIIGVILGLVIGALVAALLLFQINKLQNDLKKENKQKLVDLYQKVKKINNMSFQIFVLSLDWLYLLNVAKIDRNGEVNLCL